MDDAPRRTVKIKLDVPEERRGDFHQTKTQFLSNRTKASDAPSKPSQLRGVRKASDAPSKPSEARS